MNNNQEKFLLKAKEYAISKGGQCLSEEYKKAREKLIWKCSKESHSAWEASYDGVVMSGNWCRCCSYEERANKKKLQDGLCKAKEYAKSMGGECLSIEYINSQTKMIWKCSVPEHPSWEANYNNVVNTKRWCSQCAGFFSKEEGLIKAKEYAKSKGGECLSTEYKNNSTRLKWKCANSEHPIWEAIYNGSDSWCPKCGYEKVGEYARKKDGLIKAKEHAINKGGECLSAEYKSRKHKMKWKCSNSEHPIWESSFDSVVKNGSWCPECSTYFYKEHKIRDLLEHILDTKFPRVNPSWNINPKTNRFLQLDGYSEKLKIAFEFQGRQHYEYGIFNTTEDDLEYIKYKDKIKIENCKKNKVTLIVIDDIYNLTEETEILEYLLNLLKAQKIEIKKEIKQKDIDDIFKKLIPHQENYLLIAKEFAKNKGGECLSTKYIDGNSKLKWKCIYPNHPSWEALYSKVIGSGRWCPECGKKNMGAYRKIKDGILKAQKHAEKKGGKCLSEEYINSNSKLKWKCSNPQHPIWEAAYSSILSSGRWCPECGKKNMGAYKKNKDGLLKAQKYAENKGGKCLSEEYLNVHSLLTWKCHKNTHTSWNASYASAVTNGSWCPKCAHEKNSDKYKNKNGLLKAQEHAKSKNGECLSNEYINARAKLKWKCANPKHLTWENSYDNVINKGQWCKQCANEERNKK